MRWRTVKVSTPPIHHLLPHSPIVRIRCNYSRGYCLPPPPYCTLRLVRTASVQQPRTRTAPPPDSVRPSGTEEAQTKLPPAMARRGGSTARHDGSLVTATLTCICQPSERGPMRKFESKNGKLNCVDCCTLAARPYREYHQGCREGLLQQRGQVEMLHVTSGTLPGVRRAGVLNRRPICALRERHSGVPRAPWVRSHRSPPQGMQSARPADGVA
ncbi:hypothetical protein F5884DRAFT_30407 [Xylogone sp. PMI_703]|nr:hypothetical protein F5884DRAFT_30407 [Xylogone sp. PMI_703]